MRSLLLCGALLALLAAPALANNYRPPKPRCDPTGTFLGDGTGVDFQGNSYNWTANAQNLVDILSKNGNAVLPPSKDAPAGFYLNGAVDAVTGKLTYVAWSYGATVSAQIKETGFGLKNDKFLVLALNGKPIKRNPLNLGPLVTISRSRDVCWGRYIRTCKPRVVTIVVRPWFKIEISQPWVAGALPGQKGSFADYLDVKVTVTRDIKLPLSGWLGQTYTPSLKQQLIDAKIIPDVIYTVNPQCGLTVETTIGGLPFSNGQLLTETQVADAPTLAIKGAKFLERFVLFVVDPDAPDPADPVDRSFLHGLWWNIPFNGNLTAASAGITTGWVSPQPPIGTHRYVAVLYRQPKWPKVEFVPKDPSDPTKLAKYNVTLVAKFKKLGEPIYATWFTVEAPPAP